MTTPHADRDHSEWREVAADIRPHVHPDAFARLSRYVEAIREEVALGDVTFTDAARAAVALADAEQANLRAEIAGLVIQSGPKADRPTIEITLESSMTTFKITSPHTPGLDYHEWWFPNGWRGIGPTERRDRAARAPGKRDGYFPEWFVLACNNIKCDARAVVPVSIVLDHADAMDPDVTREVEAS